MAAKRSKAWYAAVRKANRARRGKTRASSPTRSKTLRALWKDTGYRRRLMAKRRKQWTPEANERRKEALKKSKVSRSSKMKTWWADSGNYKAMVKKRKAQAKRPDIRAKLARMASDNWKNPEIRRKMERHLARLAKNVEAKKKAAKTIRRLWSDQKYRAKQKASRKYDSAWRKSVSAGLKRRFPNGREAWNKGLTKHDHPSLMKQSKKLQGKVPDWGKFRRWYPDEEHQKIHMRSNWEVVFANWMDAGGIEWEYESKKFWVGEGRWTGLYYIPDFYLPDQDVYVELKGWMSKDNRRKMKRFEELYPNVQLWMFRRNHLKRTLKLPNRLANVLPFPVRKTA